MNSARSVNLSSKCSNIQGYCILTLMKILYFNFIKLYEGRKVYMS